MTVRLVHKNLTSRKYQGHIYLFLAPVTICKHEADNHVRTYQADIKVIHVHTYIEDKHNFFVSPR